MIRLVNKGIGLRGACRRLRLAGVTQPENPAALAQSQRWSDDTRRFALFE